MPHTRRRRKGRRAPDEFTAGAAHHSSVPRHGPRRSALIERHSEAPFGATRTRLRWPRIPHRLRVLIWRSRYLLAASMTVLIAAQIPALLTPGEPSHEIWVVTSDLPAGSTLGPEHLRLRDVPAGVTGTAQADDLLGYRLTVAVSSGQPVTATMVRSSELLDAAPPGHVVTTVTLQDQQLVELLQVGDRIDLYSDQWASHWSQYSEPEDLGNAVDQLESPIPPDEDSWGVARTAVPQSTSQRLVATGAVVLALPGARDETAGLLGVSAADTSTSVVLAIRAEHASLLSGTSTSGLMAVITTQ